MTSAGGAGFDYIMFNQHRWSINGMTAQHDPVSRLDEFNRATSTTLFRVCAQTTANLSGAIQQRHMWGCGADALINWYGRVGTTDKPAATTVRGLNKALHASIEGMSRMNGWIQFVVAALLALPAAAQSVATYQYDARGRLVETADGNGWKSTYQLDGADNRSRVVTQNQFQKAYEAESLFHAVGFAEADGWAANIYTPSSALIYGPYANDTPVGNRVATFRAMVDNVTAENNSILYIDVYDFDANQSLAGRFVTRHEFVSPWSYQVLELPFQWTSARLGHRIEFRAFYIGSSHIRIDKVGYY